MIYAVYDASGFPIYEGGSWPMARAALDFLAEKDEECPRLEIMPEAKKEP